MPKVTLKIFHKISLRDLLPKVHTYMTLLLLLMMMMTAAATTNNNNNNTKNYTYPSKNDIERVSASRPHYRLFFNFILFISLSLCFVLLYVYFALFCITVSCLAECTPSCVFCYSYITASAIAIAISTYIPCVSFIMCIIMYCMDPAIH